jgi:uncharacterized Fe-S cluster protein YjdI
VSQPPHRYMKDGLTVVWRPELCAHSGVCARGLAAVFRPKARPWVNMGGAPVESIAEQVRLCPSGALSLEEPEPDPQTR